MTYTTLNYVFNHPASNPEPLLPNIPFIPLHYRVDPPIFRKMPLQSVTFLNVNDKSCPKQQIKATRKQTSVNMKNWAFGECILTSSTNSPIPIY